VWFDHFQLAFESSQTIIYSCWQVVWFNHPKMYLDINNNNNNDHDHDGDGERVIVVLIEAYDSF
jgi:hypothetical protein